MCSGGAWALDRLRFFLDAKRADVDDRGRLPAALQQNHEWFCSLIERYAAAGHQGFLEYSRSDLRVQADAYRAWLADVAPALAAAVRS